MTSPKKISSLNILSLVVGGIIGFGAFVLPKNFLSTSGIINTFIGLFLGAILLSFVQSAYHIMLENNEDDGGEFTYTLNNLGRGHGFFVGTFLTVSYMSMIPLNVTAVLIVVRKFFNVSFGHLYEIFGNSVYISDIIIAAFVILLFAYINIRGLHISAKIQDIMIVTMIISILILLFFAVQKGDVVQFNQSYIGEYKLNIKEILKVASISPFLFIGFDIIPQVAKNIGIEKKKVGRITLLSIFIGAAIYGILNLIVALLLSKGEVLNSDFPMGDAIKNLGGVAVAILILAILFAVTSGINGFMIASSKLVFSMSQKKVISSKYSTNNKNAIIFVSILSFIAIFFGREIILYIVDLASLLASITYVYISVISYKKTKARMKKLQCLISAIIALTFIALLVLPFTGSTLLLPSFVILGVILIFATTYYKIWGNNK